MFPLIGYQWPPSWFSPSLMTKHPPENSHKNGNWHSDILSYENKDTRKQATDYIEAVVGRYSKNGKKSDLATTVAGWILGNEYGYVGLWSSKYEGYEYSAQKSFRDWLKNRYKNIKDLNARWKQDNIKIKKYLPNYPYLSFESVDMPTPFGPVGNVRKEFIARDQASWYDLTQWREQSIADYISLLAAAAKKASPEHLISYSSIGSIFSNKDEKYHAEDPIKITAECKKKGAALDFWSINNYLQFYEDFELSSHDFGLERIKKLTSLPVLITETGHTSTETFFYVSEADQAKHMPITIIDGIFHGAMGVHVFHLHDREFSGLEREFGFGILDTSFKKKPAYNTVKKTFEGIRNTRLFSKIQNSTDRKKEIAFFQDSANDTIHNTHILEVSMIWESLRQIGFKNTYIIPNEATNTDLSKYKAVVLPRNVKMLQSSWDFIAGLVKNKTPIHGGSDFFGLMGPYSEKRNDWHGVFKAIFSIDITKSLEDRIQIDRSARDRSNTPPIILKWQITPKNNHMIVTPVNSKVLGRFQNASETPAIIINKNNNAVLTLFDFKDGFTKKEKNNLIGQIYESEDGLNLKSEIRSQNPYIYCDFRDLTSNSILLMCANFAKATQKSIISFRVPATNYSLYSSLSTVSNDEKITVKNGSLQLKLNSFNYFLAKVDLKKRSIRPKDSP